MLFPALIVAALALVAIFVLTNSKGIGKQREGNVVEALNKDALLVDFGEGKPAVVKLYGITPASENEMLDDKIFAFLEEHVAGQRARVETARLGSGGVLVAKVHIERGGYVNAFLVRQGFARWAPSEAADDREIREAQEAAKAENLGIWNPAIRQLQEEKQRKMAEDAEEQPQETETGSDQGYEGDAFSSDRDSDERRL